MRTAVCAALAAVAACGFGERAGAATLGTEAAFPGLVSRHATAAVKNQYQSTTHPTPPEGFEYEQYVQGGASAVAGKNVRGPEWWYGYAGASAGRNKLHVNISGETYLDAPASIATRSSSVEVRADAMIADSITVSQATTITIRGYIHGAIANYATDPQMFDNIEYNGSFHIAAGQMAEGSPFPSMWTRRFSWARARGSCR